MDGIMNGTPLRYPGGKSIMTPFFIDLIKVNGLRDVHYAEAYAGGAGTAVNLLLGGHVDKILINDANVCIYSFWKYLVEENDRFVKAVADVSVDLDNWHYYHDFLKSADMPSFELGFATFFLSRTNRSGILTAGPIGGATEEKQEAAAYKIDCRFNKSDLISRISKIGQCRTSIEVSNQDAIEFLKGLPSGTCNLVYLDPPYFKQGKSLYLNYYSKKDHQILSEYLSQADNFRWVLSYDNVNEIREFYKNFDLYEFQLSYTAQCVKRGSELLTHSEDLRIPSGIIVKRKRNSIILEKINSNEQPSDD